MRRVCWLLPLLLMGCSCQRAPEPEPATPAPPVDVSRSNGSPSDPTERHVDAPLPLLSAVSAGAEHPGTVIHGYVGQLLRRDFAAADAAWRTAPRGMRADDAVLRALQDVVALRVNTGSPVARDTRQPSHLIEVPVQVRATTGAGTLRYSGWYRLVPDPEGRAWQIQSAQVQPVLD